MYQSVGWQALHPYALATVRSPHSPPREDAHQKVIEPFGGTGGRLNERVMAIVNLIARYIMDDEMALSEQEIVDELLTVGFEVDEIDAAFSWMESVSLHETEQRQDFALPTSVRIFSTEEKLAITSEGRGFLIRLHQLGILGPVVMEEIIERLVEYGEGSADLVEVKTLTALTLFSHTNERWQREIQCFLDHDLSSIFH